MINYTVSLDQKHSDRLEPNEAYIRIEDGPFSGVEFVYRDYHDRVDEKGNLHIEFNYGLLFSPYETVLRAEFERALGEILHDVLEKAKLVEGMEITEFEDPAIIGAVDALIDGAVIEEADPLEA